MKKEKHIKVRKISETLVDFTMPIIEMVAEYTTQEQLEQIFLIAVTVWNCVVISIVKKDNKYIDMLRDMIMEDKKILGGYSIVEALISRKKDFFADDLRGIGDFSISYSAGNLNVKAEARAINGVGIN
jgi:hypothetical protein